VQRQDGRWALTIDLGYHSNGKRNRHQGTHPTYEAAVTAARAFDYELAARSDTPGTMQLRSLLHEQLKQLPGGEDRTAVNRAWEVAHLERLLGDHAIGELTSTHIRECLRQLEQDSYAATTRVKLLRTLRRALRVAVRQGWLKDNPADHVMTPRLSTALPDEAWTEEQVARILKAAEHGRIHSLVLVALATGARMGELLAARMTDYDPATGILHIRGTAKRGGGRGRGKTQAAHRDVLLPGEVQDVLARHLVEVAGWRAQAGPLWGQRQPTREETRVKQRAAARAQAGARLPEGWTLAPPAATAYEPLFPTLNGTPWLPGNVRKHWAKVLTQAGIEYRRFHSTRAAFITAGLQDPTVSVTDIQLAVGHTSALMTYRYAQRVRGQQQRVSEAAARGLGLGKSLRGRPTPAEQLSS
jgi:integrase